MCLTGSLAVVTALAAPALVDSWEPTPPISPFPGSSISTEKADAVVNRLQSSNYKVILNRIGAAPLNQCNVLSITPGQQITTPGSVHHGLRDSRLLSVSYTGPRQPPVEAVTVDSSENGDLRVKPVHRSCLGSVVAVAVAICAGTSLGLWSAPTAAATSPDVTGKTYSDALAALKLAGFNPVIGRRQDAPVELQSRPPTGLPDHLSLRGRRSADAVPRHPSQRSKLEPGDAHPGLLPGQRCQSVPGDGDR
jgi:hypothetical protein